MATIEEPISGGFIEETNYTLATATSSTRETNGATIKFGKGTRVTHIQANNSPLGGVGGPNPPVFIGIEILSRKGKPIHLAAGFARAPTFPSTHPVITWDGDIMLPEDAEVYFAARNDTGANVTITGTVAGRF